MGEYIASKIFRIALVESASHKAIDGHFREGPLKERSVNIKWYSLREGLLDITPDSLPDYFLVLSGPKSGPMSSRGQVRAWTIDGVFLFDAHSLISQLQTRGVGLGIASSVAQQYWQEAEVYPNQRSTKLILSDEQRRQVSLFGAN